MIEEIKIERFKNIESITIPLDKITVLVGANNSGKSSILQGVQVAVSIAQTTSFDEFKSVKWKNDRLSTSLTPNQIIYVPFRDVYSLGFGGTLSQDKAKSISVKLKEKGTNHFANFMLRKGRNKNLLTEIEGRDLGERIRDIDNPYSIYVPGLAGISSFEEFKSEGIVRRAAVRGDANSVFRNILYLLKVNPQKWALFKTDFQDIFPNLDIIVGFDKLKDEYISVQVKSGATYLPIDAFGTGVLQAIQILSYVHLYSPKILILDEPDSHLHPSNQRRLAEKLIEITDRIDIQIILSTHSRHLLDKLTGFADIKWISNGNIHSDAYNFISVLLSIGALDKGDVLNNGNTRCFVLTEDSKLEPLKAILIANGFNMNETDIWSYEGCSKIEIAITLAAFIRNSAPGTRVLIHRDSDYLTEDEIQDIQRRATAADLDIFFTIGTDLENHFLNESHLQKVYPDLRLEQIREIINRCSDEVKEKSLQNFINARTQTALKIQYSGGERVDNGRISIECLRNYDENTNRFRHGKRVFKRVKNALQQHGNNNLLIPTEDLKLQSLETVRNSIWNVV
ncbi:AAA family ATPase [Flavihumibacter sp. RY-1]|uniref:AAA family ATPase n=1 Tax=Flavihumibacter fluminis TaxID=2909236 RepID=A0ABS9BIG6_9BACT|nr:ATP-binding protein [Flavihumibacter fluminis]MCF1715385.1 AAA family ATPase [Flavihumibacter fluminis]